jgi:hypothetical protein
MQDFGLNAQIIGKKIKKMIGKLPDNSQRERTVLYDV